MKQYFDSDSLLPFFTDCQDDMEEIWEAMNELTHGDYGDDEINHAQGLHETPGFDGGSAISHFNAAASWAGLGKVAQDVFEEGMPLGWFTGPFSPNLEPGDRMRDTAAAFLGVEIADLFDTWFECKCRCIAGKFRDGDIKFSDLFGDGDYNATMRALPNRDAMEDWVAQRVKEFREKIDDC